MRFYKINDDYVKFLKNIESKVQENYNEKKEQKLYAQMLQKQWLKTKISA